VAAVRGGDQHATLRTEIRSAATVMLVRDRPDLHVFMLRRTPGASFGPGATVFPGGAVDDADGMPSSRIVGLDDGAASAELGLPAGGLARRIAAVRECFEEAGILLGRPNGSSSDRSHGSLPAWRDALNAGHAAFGHVLEAEGLEVDAGELRVFSHWLTPVGAPRRYDTWFFVARAPDGQEGVHDDGELVDSAWVRPIDALRAHARGEIELILPTLRSLEVLGRFPSVTTLFTALDRVTRDERGRLLVVPDAAGERVALPGDDVAHAKPWTIPLPDIDIRSEARLAAEVTR
jgi:8-oxo-dGTP pyrophosphatase MutT (NUDIX family)